MLLQKSSTQKNGHIYTKALRVFQKSIVTRVVTQVCIKNQEISRICYPSRLVRKMILKLRQSFQAVSFDLPKLANEPCQSPGLFGWFSTGLGIRRFGCDTVVLEEFPSPPGIGISVRPLCLYIIYVFFYKLACIFKYILHICFF